MAYLSKKDQEKEDKDLLDEIDLEYDEFTDQTLINCFKPCAEIVEDQWIEGVYE